MKVCNNEANVSSPAKSAIGRVEKNRKLNAKKKDTIKTLLKKEVPLIEADTNAQLCRRIDVVPETMEDTTGNVSLEEDDQQSEILECLSKLQGLVPSASKNQSVSNLEVITSAIYYIRDLMDTLGLPACEEDSTQNYDDSVEQLTPSSESKGVSDRTSVIDANISSSETAAMSPIVTCTLLSPTAQLSSKDLRSPQRSSSKRQPLCAIHSPGNTVQCTAGQRLLQKS